LLKIIIAFFLCSSRTFQALRGKSEMHSNVNYTKIWVNFEVRLQF